MIGKKIIATTMALSMASALCGMTNNSIQNNNIVSAAETNSNNFRFDTINGGGSFKKGNTLIWISHGTINHNPYYTEFDLEFTNDQIKELMKDTSDEPVILNVMFQSSPIDTNVKMVTNNVNVVEEIIFKDGTTKKYTMDYYQQLNIKDKMFLGSRDIKSLLNNYDYNTIEKVRVVERFYLDSSNISENIYGDVNNDGKVDISDLTAIAAHVKGIAPLEGNALKNADVNNDNVVNIADITEVAAYIKGIKSIN